MASERVDASNYPSSSQRPLSERIWCVYDSLNRLDLVLADHVVIHNSPGRGALVRVGDFWYPARVLQSAMTPDGSLCWRVKVWRESFLLDEEAPQIVVEVDIRDELWQDRGGRRQIRVYFSTFILRIHADLSIIAGYVGTSLSSAR